MFNNNGSLLLALLEFFIFFAWFMCLFWIFGDLFRSRDLSGGVKTLWALFIIIVPFVGILVYLIVRGHSMTDRTLEQQKEMQAAQAEYIKSVAGSGSSGASPAEQIASAKQLLDTGAISQQEFDALKAKALAT
jgi:Phospholipase_D-nuclease N-terminal